MEPRSRQNAETDADLRRKKCGERSEDTHIKSLQLRGNTVGTRTAQGSTTYWARLEPLLPNQIFDEVRFCRLDKTYKADIKRITLNIVSPEKRLLVLEALVQTEAERKYERAPLTAMERELQGFLVDLLKTYAMQSEHVQCMAIARAQQPKCGEERRPPERPGTTVRHPSPNTWMGLSHRSRVRLASVLLVNVPDGRVNVEWLVSRT